MADPTYSINSGTALDGVTSNWQRNVLRLNPDGTKTFSDWATNTWQMPMITTANFAILSAQQGKILSTLETNDINSRNIAKTYSTAILESVVNGEHRGLKMGNVSISFMVKVT